MSKLIVKDGKHYRMRRGKMVEIPAEWVGQTVHPQSIGTRPSKGIHKRRKTAGWKPTDGVTGRKHEFKNTDHGDET